MPLVLAAGSVLDLDAAGVLHAAAAAGFDGVGLRLSGEHAADTSATSALARELGLSIHDVEVYRIGGIGVREAKADPEPLLDAAAAIGAAALLVVSDLDDRTATTHAVADLVDRAATSGLSIGLEYMAWTDPSAPLDALAVAEATGCRLVVDALHHVRVGAGPAELAAIVEAGRLGWFQLCDAPAAMHGDLIVEARHGRLPPGQGELPLRALVAELPPDTTISVEVQSDDLLAMPAGPRAELLAESARAVVATR